MGPRKLQGTRSGVGTGRRLTARRMVPPPTAAKSPITGDACVSAPSGARASTSIATTGGIAGLSRFREGDREALVRALLATATQHAPQAIGHLEPHTRSAGGGPAATLLQAAALHFTDASQLVAWLQQWELVHAQSPYLGPGTEILDALWTGHLDAFAARLTTAAFRELLAEVFVDGIPPRETALRLALLIKLPWPTAPEWVAELPDIFRAIARCSHVRLDDGQPTYWMQRLDWSGDAGAAQRAGHVARCMLALDARVGDGGGEVRRWSTAWARPAAELCWLYEDDLLRMIPVGAAPTPALLDRFLARLGELEPERQWTGAPLTAETARDLVEVWNPGRRFGWLRGMAVENGEWHVWDAGLTAYMELLRAVFSERELLHVVERLSSCTCTSAFSTKRFADFLRMDLPRFHARLAATPLLRRLLRQAVLTNRDTFWPVGLVMALPEAWVEDPAWGPHLSAILATMLQTHTHLPATTVIETWRAYFRHEGVETPDRVGHLCRCIDALRDLRNQPEIIVIDSPADQFIELLEAYREPPWAYDGPAGIVLKEQAHLIAAIPVGAPPTPERLVVFCRAVVVGLAAARVEA